MHWRWPSKQRYSDQPRRPSYRTVAERPQPAVAPRPLKRTVVPIRNARHRRAQHREHPSRDACTNHAADYWGCSQRRKGLVNSGMNTQVSEATTKTFTIKSSASIGNLPKTSGTTFEKM